LILAHKLVGVTLGACLRTYKEEEEKKKERKKKVTLFLNKSCNKILECSRQLEASICPDNVKQNRQQILSCSFITVK